jgi:hypothetical protein
MRTASTNDCSQDAAAAALGPNRASRLLEFVTHIQAMKNGTSWRVSTIATEPKWGTSVAINRSSTLHGTLR